MAAIFCLSEVIVLPYKKKVVDIPTLNRWTEEYYLPTVFRQDPVYDPIPGRVAHHNQMVTGGETNDPLRCVAMTVQVLNQLNRI